MPRSNKVGPRWRKISGEKERLCSAVGGRMSIMRCRSLSGWTKGLRVRTSRRRSYGRRSMGRDRGWADRLRQGLYRAEQSIGDRLIRIVNGRLPWAWIDPDKAEAREERAGGL